MIGSNNALPRRDNIIQSIKVSIGIVKVIEPKYFKYTIVYGHMQYTMEHKNKEYKALVTVVFSIKAVTGSILHIQTEDYKREMHPRLRM